MKKWHELSPEERKAAINGIKVCAMNMADEKCKLLLIAAADELEHPTWGQGGDTW